MTGGAALSRGGPTWEYAVASLGHALLFAAVGLVGQCTAAPEPLFAADEVLIVEMAGALPRTSRMVQKAERTPDAAVGALQAPAPPPEPAAPDALRFKTPDAPPVKGDPAADRAREQLLNELRKQAALKDLSAPLGDEDRAAASPDGVEGAEYTGGSGRPTDPELAAWVAKARQKVGDNWHPLRSLAQSNPTLTVEVAVPVDGDGRIVGEPTVRKSSGNASFDEAGRRAVLQTGTLPPLPGPYAGGITATLRFVAKEAL